VILSHLVVKLTFAKLPISLEGKHMRKHRALILLAVLLTAISQSPHDRQF
jgi:hypothetical protein